MPVIFGWLVGDMVGRALTSRVVMLMAVWLAVPFAAYFWGAAHVGPGFDVVAELGAFGAMLAFALHSPFSSTWKLALVDGLLIWCRVMTVLAAVKTVMWLFGVGYAGSFYMASSWAFRGAVAFGLDKAIRWWLGRQASRIPASG